MLINKDDKQMFNTQMDQESSEKLMQERLQERTKNINKGIDADENKETREEGIISLRKKKRQDKLNKFRNHDTDDTPVYDDNQLLLRVPPKDMDVNKMAQHIDLIPELTALISSPSDDDKMRAITGFRKLSAQPDNAPCQAIIDSNLIPVFISFLAREDVVELQIEATWALTNIASTGNENVKLLVDKGIIPILKKLMSTTNVSLRNQVIWLIGNINGSSTTYRDQFLRDNSLVGKICRHYENPINMSDVFESDEKRMAKQKQNKAITIWAISNFSRGKPTPRFDLIRNSVPTMVNHFINTDIRELNDDVMWALGYISDGDNDHIEYMLGNRGIEIVNKLNDICRNEISTLELPAVRILGNLATATDEITDLVMKTDGVKFICKMLASANETTRKEAAWVVSNFTAGTVEQTEMVQDLGVFQQCFKLLKEDSMIVKVEVAQVLSNSPNKLNENLNRKIVQAGLMDAFLQMLKTREDKLVERGLDGLRQIFETGEEMKQKQGTDINEFCLMFDELGGLKVMDSLNNIPSEKLQHKAQQLVDRQFGFDEEVDEQGFVKNEALQAEDNGQNIQQTQNTNNIFNFVPNNMNFNF